VKHRTFGTRPLPQLWRRQNTTKGVPAPSARPTGILCSPEVAQRRPLSRSFNEPEQLPFVEVAEKPYFGVLMDL